MEKRLLSPIKWLMLFALLSSSLYGADKVNTITGPATIKKGEIVTLRVGFEASQERTIAVYLQSLNPKRMYFYKRYTVNADDTRLNATFTIPNNIQTDGTFRYKAYIAPLGRYYKDHLGKAYQYGVKVESDVVGNDTISSISGPTTIIVGEEITVTIDYETTDKDLIFVLQKAASPWTSYLLKTISGNEDGRSITFTVPDNIPKGTPLMYQVILTPKDKGWEEKVAINSQVGVSLIKEDNPLKLISNSVQNITKNSASIHWSLNNYTTGQVEYGKTIDFGTLSIKEESFRYDSHAQQLKNLTPDTTYYYRVTSTDQEGNSIVSQAKTFTTLADHTAPSTKHFAVGYLSTWDMSLDDIAKIDALYTHVVISFVRPDLTFDGTNWIGKTTTGIDFKNGTMSEYRVAIKKLQDRGVKVLLAVGGGEFSHGNGWTKFVSESNSGHRAALKDLIEYLDLDGIDIDYERLSYLNTIKYPTDKDYEYFLKTEAMSNEVIPEYIKVIMAMKDIIGNDKLLTIATGSTGAECSQKMVDNNILKCEKTSYQRYLPGLERQVFHRLVEKGYKIEDIFNHITIMTYDILSKGGNNLRADPIGVFESYREMYSGPLAMGFNPAPEASSSSELVMKNSEAVACNSTSMINGNFSEVFDSPKPYSLERFIKYLRDKVNSGIMVWNLSKIDNDNNKNSTVCNYAVDVESLTDYVNNSGFMNQQ